MLSPPKLAVLAIKVHLVLLVQKESLEEMVMMELLVSQEKMEKTQNFCPLRNPSHASSAHLDLQDHTAPWDPKDHLDQKELLESHHAMVFPATLVWLDNPDLWADQDAKDHEEHLATQDASSQSPDHKAHLDLPDHPESKVQRVNQVPMVNPSKAHPENPESQANPAKKADLDLLEPQDQPETMARKAVATTAQSPAHHQAIKRHSPNERSGFRKFGNGTVSITFIFCYIFTTGRKQKNLF